MQNISYVRLVVRYRIRIRICDQNRIFWVMEFYSEGQRVVEGVPLSAVVVSSVTVAVVADVRTRPHPPYPSSASVSTGIYHGPHA